MNLNKNWVLEVKSRIYRKLRRFPTPDQKRILRVIEDLPKNPYFGDIEKNGRRRKRLAPPSRRLPYFLRNIGA